MSFEDPLFVCDRLKTRVDLSHLLSNRPDAFLVCGGPSLKEVDPNQLNQRGLWTMAVNNAAAWSSFRPSSFVCSDPPEKFHQGIWLDPAIMKFVPVPKLKKGRGVLRIKEDGKFSRANYSACDCPNVWGFLRRGWLSLDDTFFTEESAAWGNLAEGVLRTGLEKTACTMLLGIRLLYYLGARRIFLVGCDFRMEEGSGYAFDQNRDNEAIESNNRQYRNVNRWLSELCSNGVFGKYGLSIINTTTDSGLDAFPKVPLGFAISSALKGYPPCPLDTEGWYEKKIDE